MDAFIIHGGRQLRGSARVHGAKNACLPLMAAALLTNEPLVLHDVPNLADIRNMQRLLDSLGCSISPAEVGPDDSGTATNGRSAGLKLHAADESNSLAHYDIVRTMRASVCVLGPMLAKRGQARVSMPGGCNIGDRPVDLHIRGLRALGAEIELAEGYIDAKAPPGGRLKGARVFLGGSFGSTVTGTANVMCAATLATGVTVIESAACEPEVQALAAMLMQMGAKIQGAGSPRIIIEGVEQLTGTTFTVPPDRIEAATYIMAAAITNGDVTVENCPVDALMAPIDRLNAIGVSVEPVESQTNSDAEATSSPTATSAAASATAPATGANLPGAPGAMSGQTIATMSLSDVARSESVRVASNRRLEPVIVTTQPYPGFPTDLQAQLMALLCLADGNSMITEKIYPDRFLHVAELLRMGANLIRNGPTVLVQGVRELSGAPVMASDLRASAGLVLAGLAARGTTEINRVYHLDRGYQQLETVLQNLGADIERVDR